MENTSAEAMAVAGSKEKLAGDIVTQTLDTLNSDMYSSKKCKKGDNSMSETYALSKNILSAAYSDKGALVNSKS